MKRDLQEELMRQGLKLEDFEVSVNITPITTTDPEILIIDYVSCFGNAQSADYITPKVKIEISGRSMSEPVKHTQINSLISEAFADTQVAEPPFIVRAVLPERTFLEKVFLLHEEFAKGDSIRCDRMSRHMYDIYMMMSTISQKAIADESLYRSVIEHRRKFIGLRGFDYDKLYSKDLSIVPNEYVLQKWSADYEKMKMFMIYGETPSFEELVEVLAQLNKEIKNKGYKPL